MAAIQLTMAKLRFMINTLITNPHYTEPVQNGRFCWRVNKQDYWNSEVYETENAALNKAKAYCKERLGVGKHTIYIGVTETFSQDNEVLIERYLSHFKLFCEYEDLFKAMAIPKSKWDSINNALACAVEAELKKASESNLRTNINKVRHVFYNVNPIDLDIDSEAIGDLLKQIRSEYKFFNKDWAKIESLQKLLIDKAHELIETNKLPFSTTQIAIWEGFDRTKNRVHIVCDSPFIQARFERAQGDTLCKKNPKSIDELESTKTPCLSCIERLIKIVEQLIS